MKLHLLDKSHMPHMPHLPHHLSRQAHDDLLYGTLLIVGIPVTVIGARYVIETIFALFS